MALLYISGGVRRSEVARRDLADLDLEHDSLLVRGKRNEQRRLYLTEEAMAAINDWLAVRGQRPGPLLLPVAKDRRIVHDRRLDPSTIRPACHRSPRRAGRGGSVLAPGATIRRSA